MQYRLAPGVGWCEFRDGFVVVRDRTTLRFPTEGRLVKRFFSAVSSGASPERLAQAVPGTDALDRVRVKYGQRAYRFALIEAGHLVQSMLLVAEAEGIGACTVGGFFDRDVDATFGLDGVNVSAVHSAAFGHPIEGS